MVGLMNYKTTTADDRVRLMLFVEKLRDVVGLYVTGAGCKSSSALDPKPSCTPASLLRLKKGERAWNHD